MSFSTRLYFVGSVVIAAVTSCHPVQAQTAAAGEIERVDVAVAPDANWQWETVAANGQPTARHEATMVAYDGKLYLIGGRRINPVDVYDPQSNQWIEKSRSPFELHHFQAVVLDDLIYLVGAMSGPYPNETPLERVAVYDPVEDAFEFDHVIPPHRRRGAAGAAAHDGMLYLAGGITNGHVDGFQPWLDRFDPHDGSWTELADAPHARDHFNAAIHDGLLYAVGGRRTSQATNEVFSLTVDAVDVFDLVENRWRMAGEVTPLPTPRAGNMTVAWKDWIIVGGGESTQKTAHVDVEAFNTRTGTWHRWPSLQRGRHGSGFVVVGDYLYTASGSGNRGGSPELSSIERLKLPATDVVQ